MFYHLKKKSTNRKTGPMAVTTSSIANCPDSCVFKEVGCYAKYSFMGLFWKKLSDGQFGTDWETFLQQVSKLKPGSWIRFNQAGDLPVNKSGTINRKKLRELIDVSSHLNVICYTHHNDVKSIQLANTLGFPLIKSANDISDLDSKVPNSLVIPHEHECAPDEAVSKWRERTGESLRKLKESLAAKGFRLFQCPATYRDTNCLRCGACSRLNAGDVVAFPAHGTAKKKIA